MAQGERDLPVPHTPDDAAQPLLSVVICTHNRARRLGETLQSLALASPPRHHRLEILVVVNACTDETHRVVQEYASRLPLHTIVEPEAGLSRARNAGLRAARGHYILWTDDDVRVHPDWITAYERAILQWPGTTVFGGAIVPVFDDGPPTWLAETVHLCESAFARRRVAADAPIDPQRDGFPYGANFAIHHAAQRARPYDVRLGRQSGQWLTGGEELDVIGALLDAGGTARWVPDAVVDHVIEPKRQTIAYLRRYFEGHGYLLGLQERRGASTPTRPVLDAALMALRQLRFHVTRVFRPPAAWVPALLDAAIARGRYYGRRAAPSPMR